MQDQPVFCFDTPLSVSSPYCFSESIVSRFPEFLKRYDFDRCFLVTSDTLLRLHGQPLVGALAGAGIKCRTVLIQETEAHKTWKSLRRLCEKIVARGATKDSILIALGGGVIGNVVGLAAALTYRGIRFVEVPTTVMAMTDSTLSNKQAVNGARGKNHFGAYHAPLFIWADAAYPKTEPSRQHRAGIVEGIKNALIIQDGPAAVAPLLDAWQANRWRELLLQLIESKLAILRRDPSERDYCTVLEYGHTFGHAVEWLARGKLLHGEAVAIGMCLAAELSHALGFQSERFLREHHHLLGELLGAPTRLPEDITIEKLYDSMLADNKRTRKGLRYVLMRDWGEFVNHDGDYLVAVGRAEVMAMLRRVTKQSRKAVSHA
jgi:3-dehydroquinate synthetase